MEKRLARPACATTSWCSRTARPTPASWRPTSSRATPPRCASAGSRAPRSASARRYSDQQLEAIAASGGGRLHHAAEAEEIGELVLGELDALRATVVESCELRIDVPNGIRAEVIGDYAISRRAGRRRLACVVGSLASGARRTVVLKLTCPAGERGDEAAVTSSTSRSAGRRRAKSEAVETAPVTAHAAVRDRQGSARRSARRRARPPGRAPPGSSESSAPRPASTRTASWRAPPISSSASSTTSSATARSSPARGDDGRALQRLRGLDRRAALRAR